MTTSSTSEATTICPASFVSDELVQRVSANLVEVRRRIRDTGRSLESVRIVAVTKTFAAEAVRAAAMVGLTTVGENYVDELIAKQKLAGDVTVRWHYLGALQTNKIARVARVADVLCGVSRPEEIDRIATARAGMAIYVQVDFTGAPARNGALPGEVARLVDLGRDLGLDVRGLMTVAPVEREAARRAFVATDALCQELGLAERSMGMSDDLELACECATTEVRVGRALFGPREDPRRA